MNKQKFIGISFPIMLLGSLMDYTSTMICLSQGLNEANPIAKILVSINPGLLFVLDMLIIIFVLKFFVYAYYDSYKPGDYTSVLFEFSPMISFGLVKIFISCYNISLLL